MPSRADLVHQQHGELPPAHVGARKAPARTRVVFTMDTVDAEVLRDTLAVLRARLGEDAVEVDDGELLASLARRALHDMDPDTAPTAERWRIVVERCPDCGRTEGQTAELTDTAALVAGCDARILERGRESSRVPPAVRRTVLLRDQRRCRVPGCSNHLWCDIHHVCPRSLGGRITSATPSCSAMPITSQCTMGTSRSRSAATCCGSGSATGARSRCRWIRAAGLLPTWDRRRVLLHDPGDRLREVGV